MHNNRMPPFETFEDFSLGHHLVIISNLFSFWQTLVTKKLKFYGFLKCKFEKKIAKFLEK